MTRTSCLGTAKCSVFVFNWEERRFFDFLPSTRWASCQKSTVIGLLLRH